MDLDLFEDIVWDTVKELPEEFSKAMDNVGITVELWPTEDEMRSIQAHPGTLLFGLYRGIPRTKRNASYSALPDKIIIYAGPILMTSKTLESAKIQIKKTVLHEIGHHFGMSEESIRRAQESV